MGVKGKQTKRAIPWGEEGEVRHLGKKLKVLLREENPK